MNNIRVYIGFVGLYWLFLAALLLGYGYRDSFLLLNSLNWPWLDYFMYVLTWFGDSLFIASVMVLAFPRKTSLLLMMILSLALTGILVQLLKQWVFGDWDRPLKVFENSADVHIIGDYRLFHRSFPSGHSVTTGAAFTVLAWYLRDKRYWVIMAGIMAVIVSYTRIYTGSHFAGDVLAGSVLGTLLTVLFIFGVSGKIDAWVSRWTPLTEHYFRKVLQIVACAGIVLSVITYMRYIIG
ncbi:MAG: phosphatase PAP2 family protein [Bacteroidales bacterium]